MKKMNILSKELLDCYLKVRSTINRLSDEIIGYCAERYPDYIAYGEDAAVDEWDIDETEVIIYTQGDEITVPIDAILNNKWKEYLDNYFKMMDED